MPSALCLLLAFSSSISFTVGVLFDEETILGDDATGYGPIFEEEPVDVVYTEGSPDGRIFMNCRARANPPASYSWQRNNLKIKLMELPDEHYSLVGGNLVINNPQQEKHTGTYICLARNIYGTVVSKVAHVKFGYLEEFPQEEKEPVYVKEGQGAVLLCAPPKAYPQEVTYRWIYNEFPVFLHTDNRRFVSQKTGNLYIAKVEAQDAGNYSCFVSSPIIGKSVFSKFIPLVPLPPEDGEERRYPADIRVKFPNTTAMLASNITLECFALGNPIPHIMWRKVDATDLPPNHEISESGSVLHLYNVQYDNVGAYDCEAINTEGKDNHKAQLSVESAPEWVETINSTQKDLGSRHTMRCMAEGQPSPSIRWFKDGLTFGKGELTFSSLALDDSGMYQCAAENNWGIKYATAELRVITYAPTFEFNPVKKQLLGAKGGRVLIECKPRAAPKPHLSWTKGKELLFSNSRISVFSDGTLEILNATKNDEGFYTCIAENYRGRGTSTGYLTITEKPSPPGDVRIDEIGDTWVTLEWTKEAEHNSPITHYTVQTRFFWALHEGDWRNASTSPTVIDGSLEKADVTDLFPWMDHQFRITAHNEYGAGEASIPSLKIKTLDAFPVVYPTDVSGYWGTNGEIIITWTPVQPWYFYGKKFGYVVALKPYSAYDWWYDAISDPQASRHVHRVSIPTDEDFLVKIKCFNVKGEGPYSHTIFIFANHTAHA